MEKKSLFQTVLLAVFGSLIVLGFIAFSAIRPKSSGQAAGLAGTVTIWGTFQTDVIEQGLGPISKIYKDLNIEYTQIPESQFENRFVESLASGTAPDLVILPHEEVLRQRNRLIIIPPELLAPQVFQTEFAGATQSFLLSWGTAGVPFAIDPLVLYYNNDILNSSYIITPATTWQELEKQIPDLTVVNEIGQIQQSAIAMGSASNIPNMVPIVMTLAMQAGGNLIGFDDEKFTSGFQELGANPNNPTPPFADAFTYYLSFSDPTVTRYSWNTGMMSAQDSFLAGESAYYIGYASEYQSIREKNPNLNFAVSPMLQLENAKIKVGAATVYGVAVTRTTSNPDLAIATAKMIGSPEVSGAISKIMGMAPSGKAALAQLPPDLVGAVTYKSAIISRSWWVPGTPEITKLFSDIINNTQSGITTLDDALGTAGDLLDIQLGSIRPPVFDTGAVQ